MSDRTPSRGENGILVALFFAALFAHCYFATVNWSAGFMPGHEFRQTQTAVVSRYIDEQNNFSLLYETPLMGKPWVSILLEVPFYEWSVVLVSRTAGVPHVVAARTVSLTCFYLALPAIYLLLARFGLPRPRRLLVLALILTCPVYIFYSRAFLMESMVIMCCAWFLLGFVRTMDERRWGWLALANVAGTLAALIKSVTFAVWLVPAAGYGVWMLWRDLRSGQGWVVPLKTGLWGAATVVVALGALKEWIALTDPIKAAHSSAWIFTAKNLSEGNWGILALAGKFSPTTWGILWERWQEAIMSPWLLVAGLVVGLALFRQVRGQILLLAGVFFVAQLMFPFAYAYQDYYFYACTMFVLGALAYVGFGALDSRLPRWCGWLVVVFPLAAQLTTYWHGYRELQIIVSDGGFPFTAAVRDLTPPDSVIVVAGNDWSGMISYYTERKALMIRRGLEYDPVYLNRAFDDLADENVSALILSGETRENRALIALAAEKFTMDTVPTFSNTYADVYCNQLYIDEVQKVLGENSGSYGGLTVKPRAPQDKKPSRPFRISPSLAKLDFENITPAPFRAYFQYGLAHQMSGEDRALVAHAHSELWLQAPAAATRIRWEYGIIDSAFEKEGEPTDGAEFTVTGETPDGNKRIVYRRILDPLNVPTDRGVQRENIPYQPLPGEKLQFATGPNQNPNFDWAYWVRIEVK